MKFILEPSQTANSYNAIIESDMEIAKGDVVEFEGDLYAVEDAEKTETKGDDWYHLKLGKMPETNFNQMFPEGVDLPESQQDEDILKFLNDLDE